MGGLRLAGALWIIAGLSSAGLLIIVFVFENMDNPAVLLERPFLPVLAAVAALTGIALGILLIVRPGPAVVRWSNVIGVAWFLAFGSQVLTHLGEPIWGPLFSSAWLTGFGIAAALIGFYNRRNAERQPSAR